MIDLKLAPFGADDIANAIVFRASPRGANISGQALPFDAHTHAVVRRSSS